MLSLTRAKKYAISLPRGLEEEIIGRLEILEKRPPWPRRASLSKPRMMQNVKGGNGSDGFRESFERQDDSGG